MPDDAGTGWWWWVRRVAAWMVVFGALAVLAAAVIVPRLTGATPYTVASGSMRPTYQPGDLVVVRPAGSDEIGIGTAITYQLESGRRSVVTHRVVAIQYASDGEVRYRTRGDANGAIDAEPVRPVQVHGVVWYHVDHLGYVNSWLTGRQHQVLTWIVAAALGLYALVMFGGGATDARRRRATASGDRG